MGRIAFESLDFEAFRTGPGVTEAALPGRGQEAGTIGRSTPTDELGGNRFRLLSVHALLASRANIVHASP